MTALPNTQITNWKEPLARRGILEAALECGWALKEIHGVSGWAYPLKRFDGTPFGAQRWKAIDRASASAAYLWLTGDKKKPESCNYYWGAGTKAALEDSWGVLYITAGEPDMLSMIAAGRRNVTSFFGESNIPETLVSDLQKINVSQVVYLADMDNVGIDAAVKLTKALEGLIPCDVKRLPHEYNGQSIKDVNDLWIACGFDKATFNSVIDSAPLWVFGADIPLKPYYNYEAYAEAVEHALRLPEQKRNGWSKPVVCIFANHTHDDKQPSMGWNYKTHQCRCFKCGETWGCDEVAQRLGISLEDFNENAGKTRADLKIVQAVTFAPAAAPALNDIIRTSDESLERYKERLDGKHLSDVTAAPFPFTTLHSLGGFCEILKPRKMVGVIGLSGGGKTSFLESLIDVLRQAGEFHTFWWGKEWRWDEMSDRAIQRQGGLTLTQMAKYEMYLSETRNGGKARYGVKPSDELIAESKRLADEIKNWAGKVFYIDKSTDLNSMLEHAQKYLDEKKAAGIRIRVAVWDYASLFEVRGARSEMETISTGLKMVKDFGETNDLYTFVASQPRKDDATKVKDGDKLLSAEDAMYMNDHKFNLLMTLNPTYIEGKIQGEGVINVVKNSGGNLGKVTVQMDLRRLRWLDKGVGDGWS